MVSFLKSNSYRLQKNLCNLFQHLCCYTEALCSDLKEPKSPYLWRSDWWVFAIQCLLRAECPFLKNYPLGITCNAPSFPCRYPVDCYSNMLPVIDDYFWLYPLSSAPFNNIILCALFPARRRAVIYVTVSSLASSGNRYRDHHKIQ